MCYGACTTESRHENGQAHKVNSRNHDRIRLDLRVVHFNPGVLGKYFDLAKFSTCC